MSGQVPEVVDEPEPDEIDESPDVDEASDTDVEEAVVDLTEDDMGGDGLFDGVEDDDDVDKSGESDEGGDEGGEGEDEGDGSAESPEDVLGANAAALEDSINEGVARLAVIGLEEEDLEEENMTKSELESEFSEVFAAFRLGYFGSRFAEEYVLNPADGDVDPTWGLLGSSLMAFGMIVWLRPDGDQAVSKIRDSVGDLAGGIA